MSDHGRSNSSSSAPRVSKGRSFVRGALACAAALLSVYSAAAADDAPSAEQIAKRIVSGDAFRWDGGQSRVRMVLIEADGKKKERAMDVIGRQKDGRFQTVLRFLSPEDIAGTAFLMLEKGGDASEQYIYLPGIKRTRRIAGRERDGSFMGSDFSYADMQPPEADSATHKKLPDENLGSDACYVLESTPKPGTSNYGKLMVWARKSDYIALRTRFYDRSGKLLKTLYVRRVKPFEGKPVVVEARMQTQDTNHATEMFVDSLEKREGLSDAQFTPAALEHL